MRHRGIAIPLVLCAAACEPVDWGPDQLGAGHTSRTLRQAQLGREVYATYCVGCHGEKGDGQGPAARFLDPKPRDFRVGRMKFANVASGEAPRDEDYMRVIQHGLAGTAMPSFALLSEQERAAAIAYLKGFIDADKREVPGASLSSGKDPWAGRAEAGIAAGRKAYHTSAQCWSCHPAYVTRVEVERLAGEAKVPVPEMRARPFEAELKDSDWGAQILPPDFLGDRVKTGLDVENLAQVINAGVGGTAMPTWAGALPPEQVWGLAYYIRSLALMRGTPDARALQGRLLASQKEVAP